MINQQVSFTVQAMCTGEIQLISLTTLSSIRWKVMSATLPFLPQMFSIYHELKT